MAWDPIDYDISSWMHMEFAVLMSSSISTKLHLFISKPYIQMNVTFSRLNDFA